MLILDEINRADLSRLFGEAFSALELEKRGEPIDLSVEDPATEKPRQLAIPPKLFVIGTMNLIDQSVEQIDFAMRRRFLWQESRFDQGDPPGGPGGTLESRGPETTVGEGRARYAAPGGGSLSAEYRIATIEELGEQYEIGHTYLFDIVKLLDAATTPRATTFFGRERRAEGPGPTALGPRTEAPCWRSTSRALKLSGRRSLSRSSGRVHSAVRTIRARDLSPIEALKKCDEEWLHRLAERVRAPDTWFGLVQLWRTRSRSSAVPTTELAGRPIRRLDHVPGQATGHRASLSPQRRCGSCSDRPERDHPDALGKAGDAPRRLFPCCWLLSGVGSSIQRRDMGCPFCAFRAPRRAVRQRADRGVPDAPAEAARRIAVASTSTMRSFD